MSPIASRISRLSIRVRESACPHTIAFLVAAMTAELDPEAIAALIPLLDHRHDGKDSVSRALFRYGDAAEESLRAFVATEPKTRGARSVAEELLAEMAYRARLLEVGCF